MRYRVWAAIALLSTAAFQVACASSLDFDHVSSGQHASDAGAVHTMDAGSSAPVAPTASEDRFDASAPMSAADAGAPPTTPPAMPVHPPAAAPAHDRDHDAGIPFSTATSAAASFDAGAAEAALPADPSAFSCAKLSPKPWFCDDFESLGLSSHWSAVVVNPTEPVPGGSIDIDGTAARAGQYSLLAEVNQGVSVCNNCIEVRTGLTLPTLQGPTKLTVEFDMRVEQIDMIEGRRVILFQVWWGALNTGFTQHTLQLGASDGNAWTGLVEVAQDAQPTDSNDPPNQTPTDHQWQQTPMLSEWVHVMYALDVQDALGTANVARLTVGDVVLFDGPLSFALPDGKASLELGLPWVDMNNFGARETSKRWRVRYDNVVVRYEPR